MKKKLNFKNIKFPKFSCAKSSFEAQIESNQLHLILQNIVN